MSLEESRICIVPEYPMGLMSGGLQVQAVETCRALKELGLNADLLSWSADDPGYDLYHFIGFPSYLSRVTELVAQAGKPYVLTMLTGGALSAFDLWKGVLYHRITDPLGRSEYRRAVRNAAAIITITEGDATVVSRIYGVQRSSIQVVRNGVSSRFFHASKDAWTSRFGKKEFVLCVGSIQRRKNQLLLLRACNGLKLPVILLGPVLPGEVGYAGEVEAVMRENMAHGGMWLRDLPYDSPLLASAYAACRLYVLLSSCETQPLSVLEAMACGKPVLIANAGYSNQPPFEKLMKTDISSLDIVAQNVSCAWKTGMAASLPTDFTWGFAARKLENIYRAVLR